ncbi:MAG: NUDIX hydrolase, partial [Pseudomonadota bacterium]|nr:NUDIX hydrolase [Pseudomonadota bacterium]
PTLRNLEKLAEAQTVDEALRNATNSTIVPVLPWTEKRDDGNYLCIPVEAGYAISEEKMPDRGV